MLKDFYYDYILLNLEDYGFGIDLEICKALFIVSLGVCVAIVMINYNRANMFTVLKQLMRHEAFSEDSAKTLKELGLCDKCAVKYSLSRPGQLTRLIKRVGETTPTYDEYIAAEKEKKVRKKALRAERNAALAAYRESVKEAREQGLTPPERPTFESADSADEAIDFAVARFYIPDETHDRCKHLFENNSASLLKTVLAVVFILVAYVILVMLMPDILNLLSRLIVN